jgi:hypothetical protein
MARARFAAAVRGTSVPSIKKLAIALAAIAVAASLAGCATAPGSVEEQLWFDKATGADVYYVPPGIRIRGAIGYPRTDGGFYRHAIPVVVEEP